jgi:long-chain acyl-CoA synthetase
VIAADGEILARGHNVMSGYWNAATATADVIDADGWLHTGDIGEIVDGFLRITDRKKDLIITAGGKNIAPQKIESRLMAHTGLGQAMVLGDRRPFLVALITLDETAMMAISDREGLGCRNYADLVRHPRIRRLIQDAVDRVNADLASYETVKKFAIPPADFSEMGGELTPTLKVRRRIVAAKYADLVESLYEETSVRR